MTARAPRRRAPARARRAAFTLIELMVALVIGGLVIGAMYSIGAASNRNFQVQHQIANMQSSLRLAYIHLKRDLVRAGYHATPREALDACTPSGLSISTTAGGSGLIAAISSFTDNVAANVVDPTAGDNPPANGFSHDQVTLIGNYTTSNEYPGIQLTSTSTLRIDTDPATTWHSIQQDFGWNANGMANTVINADIVREVFPTGKLIRIQTKTGRRHYATLVGQAVVLDTSITLTFQPAITNDCANDANGGWVAPLDVVRWDVRQSGADTWDTERVTGNQFAQLVRSVVQPNDKITPFAPAQPPRPILDYVATFNLQFTTTAQLQPGQPDQFVVGLTADVALPAAQATALINNNPELVRAVRVELGVRTPATDPGMRWPCPFQACMALEPDPQEGAPTARVRVLRSEIFLPNLAMEGY